MAAKEEIARLAKVIDYGEEGCRPANEKTGCPLWKPYNGRVFGMSRSGTSTGGGYAGPVGPNWVRCLGA